MSRCGHDPDGEIASGVLKATYDTVELGITLAHNANLEGPRVVQSITNEVLGSAGSTSTGFGPTGPRS